MKVISKEEWRTVVVNGEVYENYMVSNLGRIKSLKFGKEKILKLIKNRGNYLFVNLCKDGKQKIYTVHRLVALAFIPKTDEKNCVDHIDGNRQNNNVNNLRWCSQKENCNFYLAKKHYSEAQKGEKNYMYGKHLSEETKRKIAKANSKAILCIELNKIFESSYEAERELGINNSNINMCCNGKRKSAGNFHWCFID